MQLTRPHQLQQWREHCSFARGPEQRTVDPDQGLVVWQLSSRNNRALARSDRGYATVEDALADAVEIRRRHEDLVIRSVKLGQRPVYGWIGTLDSETVLLCARSYSTVRDTRDSITVAAAALAESTVVTQPRKLAGSGIVR